jgi:hypothetical protein
MTPRRAAAVATSSKKPVKARVAAMANVSEHLCKDDATLQSMLKVLRDTAEPTPVRLAALQALQAASFAVVEFEPCRADYLAALRAVATDPDPELRQRVLGLLAREKDAFAQERLLEGLKNPAKALVPPEKALQLLSYDVHAAAYPVARQIVNAPPNPTAKREALRLLAADAASKPMFEQILRDKKERADIRQISASALQAIAPTALQTHAREILLDTSESRELQSTSLTALTEFGDAAEVGKDDKLMKRVASLKGTKAPKVKRGAQRFLAKYRR